MGSGVSLSGAITRRRVAFFKLGWEVGPTAIVLSRSDMAIIDAAILNDEGCLYITDDAYKGVVPTIAGMKIRVDD